MADERVSWFNTILSILSQGSKNLVEAEDMWEQIRDRQDPLPLWRLVEKTHLTRVTGSTDIDRFNAMKAYNKVEQGNHESIPDYKKRHERAVEALELVEHPAIPDMRSQVVKWIQGLNFRHEEWKTKMINAMQEGENPPDTLEEAVRQVTNYVPLHPITTGRRESEGPSTAFMTEGDLHPSGDDSSDKKEASDHDKPPKPPRGKANKTAGKVAKQERAKKGDKSKKKKPTEESADDDENEDDGAGSCWTCGQSDHWAGKCPYRNKIHQLVKEKKITLLTKLCLHDSAGKP
jgi:hypothetical protein